jgi:hypothetical protein
VDLADDGRITGTGTTNLSISDFRVTDVGAYRMVVTNHYHWATSSVATLTTLSVAGSYAGLFFDTNNGVTVSNAGYFTARVTANGLFSARLHQGTRAVPIFGRFSSTGTWSSSSILNAPGWTVTLQLAMSGGDQIEGTVSNACGTSQLLANRAPFSWPHRSPQVGKYALYMPGSQDPAVLPGGCGYAFVIVNALGKVTYSGVLGDGTPITGSTFVSEQGQWPLCNQPYHRKGLVLGWINFTNNPVSGTALEGVTAWLKPEQPLARLYRDGFDWPYSSETNNVLGTTFTNRFPPLPATNGAVVLNFGNLAQTITYPFTVNSSYTIQGTNGLTIRISPLSGFFRGSALNPATAETISFSGAYLQGLETGYGFFLGTNQSGSVTLTSYQNQ